ncbi:ALI_HP2_G0043480.mRNA.1.CDS.1 [Saccharomyces cerevisiae]|nr:ALI_HP2_G0043480.mRNA.1.CDS.1 [Saccharomyces cerevisiae]CAI6647358.1 ALI_HP2_G0043480.mRNA.1.CDS.1 [Saccharomyces cerevisiae]CAI6727441.1 ALI_HP1_G0044170.mRNA.1.CDS.1 [Saccharomyces cerevisiae]
MFSAQKPIYGNGAGVNMGGGGPSTNDPGSMSMPGVPTPMGPGMNQQIPSGGPMLMGNTPNNNNSNENGENNGNNGNNGGNDANATRNNPNMVNNRGAVHALDDPNVYHWICQLTYGPQKEQALLELGRKREQFDDLAVVLWSSFGVMTSLLNEIISVYPMLQPQMLSNNLSNRVCNALVLLQCVASHPETKHLFLQAHIPLFLFPFLNTTSRQRTFEYLRLTSLGVIGALVKNDSQDVITFLLRTDIVPLCLRIMESSSELSKTVAIFILQKILLDDVGLQYICATLERFYAVTNVLKDMVEHLTVSTPPGRLLKHIIRCYLRLSDDLEARRLLKIVLPAKLRDNTFTEVLRDDVGSKRCLAQLLLTLNEETS